MIVVDTNVLVAGLLTGNADSPVAWILDGMLAAGFPFALSETLLAEYRTVLLRPAIRKQHALNEAEIDALLVDIAHHAVVIQPAAGPPAPDPGDQMLWDLLHTRPDLVLVTGDRMLLEDQAIQGRVLSPREFVSRQR